MTTDWFKYILQLLPPRMHTIELIEMIRVLLGDVPQLETDFDLFLADAKFRVNVNASTLMLEKLISHDLDAIVEITPLDGDPIDFLVTTFGVVDEARLKALIDAHKLAGKSYTFKLGAVEFSAEFTNYVCEDIIEIMTATFSDYVCENDGYNAINVYIGGVFSDHVTVYAVADAPVQSELLITGNVVAKVGSTITNSIAFSITIAQGATSDNVDVSLSTEGYSISVDQGTVDIHPASDDYYEYINENDINPL